MSVVFFSASMLLVGGVGVIADPYLAAGEGNDVRILIVPLFLSEALALAAAVSGIVAVIRGSRDKVVWANFAGVGAGVLVVWVLPYLLRPLGG